MPPLPSTPGPAAGETALLAREDEGYHHDLQPRQLQMIAIGGAIGTGLFLGAGGRLASAGPGLFLVYGVCGGFVPLCGRRDVRSLVGGSHAASGQQYTEATQAREPGGMAFHARHPGPVAIKHEWSDC